MTHPDGEISFFNDAAFDIAPTLADLVRYADVIFAARQAQPIPAVIPAGKPESSAMDGKAAFNDHSAAAVRGPTVPGLGPGFPAGTTRESAVIPAGMTGARYHSGRDDVRAPSPPTRRPRRA